MSLSPAWMTFSLNIYPMTISQNDDSPYRELPIPMIHVNFPSFSSKSAHPSVNLPPGVQTSDREIEQMGGVDRFLHLLRWCLLRLIGNALFGVSVILDDMELIALT